MRIDIMTDIETLGVGENVTIIQLSAVAFDIQSGSIISTFNQHIDISKDKNLNVDGSTLAWWLHPDRKDLLSEIVLKGDISLVGALMTFKHWILGFDANGGIKNVYLWGNGILFDNRIIQDIMTKNNIEYPIFYRNDRDVRTIVDLACMKLNISADELKMKLEEVGTKHDAYSDSLYQINLVSYCYKILIG